MYSFIVIINGIYIYDFNACLILHSIESVISKRSEGKRKQRMKKKREQVRRRKRCLDSSESDTISQASSSKIMKIYTTTTSWNCIPMMSKVNTPGSSGTQSITRKRELGMNFSPLNKKKQIILHPQPSKKKVTRELESQLGSVSPKDKKKHPQRTRLIFNGQSCTPPNQDNFGTYHTSVRRKLFPVHSRKSEESICDLCVAEKDAVEDYGMLIPDYIQDNGPRLVKFKYHELCNVEKERRVIANANHAIISQWLRQAAIAEAVGSGKEKQSTQALQSQEKADFKDGANKVMSSLASIQRYPIDRYIEDICRKEKQAVEAARMYRNKFEEEQLKGKKAASAAAKQLLSVRTFWRNNIAEQCSRGGQMLNLSLKKLKSK